jgi:hypothetical protein
MYLTGPAYEIDWAARYTRGFRRFDSDLGGEYGHLLINKKILSNSPFGRTTQTGVAFHLHELAAQGAVSPFHILKKQQARHTRSKCPLVNACACPSFFWGSQRDQIMQRNRQQDQRGCMGGGGGAARAPSNRGKSLESWCVENTVLLRAGWSYKTGKLLIAGERPVDELPP